jgi:hypothetical protein
MLNPWGEPPPDGSPYGGTAPSPTPRRVSRGQPATVSIATKAASGYKPQNLLITGPRMRARLAMTGPWFLSIVRDRRIAFREALNQDLPPLPWRWRQQNPNSAVGLQAPSGPHAMPSSLGLRPRMQVTLAQERAKLNAPGVKPE